MRDPTDYTPFDFGPIVEQELIQLRTCYQCEHIVGFYLQDYEGFYNDTE